KVAGGAWESPAPEVRVAEIEQPVAQRPGIIDLFSDLHGILGVPDRLVEPAELGERIGEPAPRDRRPDAGCSETLVARVALERDVRLEDGDRLAELPPSAGHHAKRAGGNGIERAIAKGPCDAQSLLPESEGLSVVATDQVQVPHEVSDPREPMLVTQRSGQHLRLVQMLAHPHSIAEREARVPHV